MSSRKRFLPGSSSYPQTLLFLTRLPATICAILVEGHECRPYSSLTTKN